LRNVETVEEVVMNHKLISVTCNKCSKRSTDEGYGHKSFQEFNTSFGYGSRYDSQNWSFDLCDDCLTELIQSFKIVPTGFGESSYYATYPQIMFDEWKETGVVDLEAGMTEEEIAANGGSIYTSDGEQEEDD
jgi:hypothetical protein